MNKNIYNTNRKSAYPLNENLINRWSPRAMSGEEISKDELMTLFEAARWAPSAFNGQPWRFIYATRETEDFKKLFELLIDFNKSWVKNAAALVVMISRKTSEHNNKPSTTHRFDTGAAWENMALQGTMNNLVVHAMTGFDLDKANELLSIPENYEIQAMVAIGRPGNKEDLPEEIRAKEEPNDRKLISEIIFEGLDNIIYK